MLSGRGLCDELITRTEESYRLCCVVVCNLETSRIGAPYMYDISNLRVKSLRKIIPKYMQLLAAMIVFAYLAHTSYIYASRLFLPQERYVT